VGDSNESSYGFELQEDLGDSERAINFSGGWPFSRRPVASGRSSDGGMGRVARKATDIKSN
jgi:hypothetical protein